MKFYHGIDPMGRKTTTAVIINSRDHARDIVAKKLGISKRAAAMSQLNHQFGVDDITESVLNLSSLDINDTYKGTVRCAEDDTYDASQGAKIACEKAYDHMKTASDKAIKRWQKKMLLKIESTNPETFRELLNEMCKNTTDNVEDN